MTGRSRTVIVLLLVLLAGGAVVLAAGWSSTNGNFYLDSEGYFRGLPYFQERSLSWGKIQDAVFRNPYPGGKRWIPNLTFLLENKVVGLTPASGRVTGMLIHALNISLVFLLLYRVLLLMGSGPSHALAASVLGAGLWGLNPFQAESVFYVIQRMTLLYATFYLVAVLCYLVAREKTGATRLLWLGAAALAAICSILSKENGVLVVLGIAVLELVLPGKGRQPGSVARRAMLTAVALLALTTVMMLALGYDPVEILRGIVTPGQAREFTPYQRLLTEGRVMVHYLSLLFFPLPHRFSLVMKYPLSQSPLSPPWTLLSWALIAVLVWLAVSRRRSWPLMSAAVLWFFANHLIESTVLNLEVAFLHRNYLPSVLLFLPVSDWLAALPQRGRKWPLWTAAALVLILFTAGFHVRARTWGDPEVFWKDVIEKSPGSLRGYINLGIIYDLRGDESMAMEIYDRGAQAGFEEKPGFWGDLYCNMGMALMDLGRHAEAEPYLDRALSITLNEDYLYNMARLQRTLGNPAKGLQALSILEKRNPYYPDLHLMKARYLLDSGNREGARRELAEEVRLYPGNREARVMLQGLGR